MRLIFLAAIILTLNACSKVGSDSWCADLKETPKGKWTTDETAQYTKYCVLGLDPNKWCEKMADEPKDELSMQDAKEYAERCVGTN